MGELVSRNAEMVRSFIPLSHGCASDSPIHRIFGGVMKEKIKTILFIASVALNAVFAGTYVTYKLPSLAAVHHAVPEGPLFLQFDLTPDQLTRFKVERDKFRTLLQELGRAIKTKQIELIDLLGASLPDQQAIERKQEEIQRLQGAVQDRVIIHFLQASKLLTPEQRTRFYQLIKARIETSVQACPPWMRSIEQGQTGESKIE
jgi:Spy/CpxP family protein refolding chaperone